jgi:hypothetical protein
MAIFVVMRLLKASQSISSDLRLFLFAVSCFGFGGALVDAIFNNFLDTQFHLDGLQRTLLEVPREVPWLSVAFVSALFAGG